MRCNDLAELRTLENIEYQSPCEDSVRCNPPPAATPPKSQGEYQSPCEDSVCCNDSRVLLAILPVIEKYQSPCEDSVRCNKQGNDYVVIVDLKVSIPLRGFSALQQGGGH